MNPEDPIAFFDSGIGGLTYLENVRREMPNEGYVYLVDNAAFPYGEKSPEVIRGIVLERVGRIIDHCNPKAIVVACNTASVVALESLRSRYDPQFIGVVPAVKPAALRTKKGRIGLLATNETVADAYTDGLIQQHASACEVVRITAPELISFIEKRIFHAKKEERSRIIENSADKIRSTGVDIVVIGCTHFIYIEEDLRIALGNSVEIIDSIEGVGRQAKKIVNTIGRNAGPSQIKDLYVTGSENGSLYREIAQRYSLHYKGVLP